MSILRLIGEEDKLFESESYPKPFAFNAQVAGVFDNMITRSVPMYSENQESIWQWAKAYYQAKTKIYDIGCSTGTSLYH